MSYMQLKLNLYENVTRMTGVMYDVSMRSSIDTNYAHSSIAIDYLNQIRGLEHLIRSSYLTLSHGIAYCL
jgi:hypothetical protein